MDEANVVVLDNEGNVVATKAELVAEGQTEVTFDFVTPFAANYEFEGVWSVDGVEFNFDAINQFDAIIDAVIAENEVELLEALEAAGIENVDEDLITDYFEAIRDAEEDPEDLADIQELINEANKEAGKEVDQTAAVKAVEAADNQVQLLNALSANFDRVNKDWIVEYAKTLLDNKVDGKLLADYDTFDEIQDEIDRINIVEIEKEDGLANTAAKQAAVTALIETWMKPDAEKETAKANAIEASKLKEAEYKVYEANTANRLYNALVDYANLLDDKDELDVEDIKEENKAYYFEEQAKGVEPKVTPEAIVEQGNAAAISESDETAAEAFIKTVSELPKVSEINAMDADQLAKAKTDIEAARAEYKALSDGAKEDTNVVHWENNLKLKENALFAKLGIVRNIEELNTALANEEIKTITLKDGKYNTGIGKDSALKVERPVTIKAENKHKAVLEDLLIRSDDVTVDGVTANSIEFNNVKGITVTNNVLVGDSATVAIGAAWGQNNGSATITNNKVLKGSIGLYPTEDFAKYTITGNTIENVSGDFGEGIWVAYNEGKSINNVTVDEADSIAEQLVVDNTFGKIFEDEDKTDINKAKAQFKVGTTKVMRYAN